MAVKLRFVKETGDTVSITQVESDMEVGQKPLRTIVRGVKALVDQKSHEAAVDTQIAQEGCKADGATLCRRTPACGGCVLG